MAQQQPKRRKRGIERMRKISSNWQANILGF